MKKIIILCVGLLINTMSAQDSLHFEWEATTVFGQSAGSKLVSDGSTLLHHSGLGYAYQAPFESGWNSYSYLAILEPNGEYYQHLPVKLISRRYLNAEYYDGNIYFFGGYNSSSVAYPSEVEIYNVSNGSITLGAPLPTARVHAGSALWDGKIYVIGGQTSEASSNKVEIYDVASNSWTSGSNFPIAAHTEAIAYNNKLYAVGAYIPENDETLDSFFEYDIATDTWSELPGIPNPTSAHDLAVYNGVIICMTDYEDLTRIMTYTISTSEWKEYKSNIIGSKHASVAILNNRLYYAAGHGTFNDKYQYFNTVQSLDLNSTITAVTSEPGSEVSEFKLSQNYPNPFNPVSTIRFSLLKNAQTKLEVYNSIGQLVETLVNEKLQAGNYTKEWNAEGYASGVYIYKLTTPNFVESRKMTLVK